MVFCILIILLAYSIGCLIAAIVFVIRVFRETDPDKEENSNNTKSPDNG